MIKNVAYFTYMTSFMKNWWKTWNIWYVKLHMKSVTSGPSLFIYIVSWNFIHENVLWSKNDNFHIHIHVWKWDHFSVCFSYVRSYIDTLRQVDLHPQWCEIFKKSKIWHLFHQILQIWKNICIKSVTFGPSQSRTSQQSSVLLHKRPATYPAGIVPIFFSG